MVSSGDVIKQSDAFVDELGEYSTQISGLQGSWEGSSYNNLYFGRIPAFISPIFLL